MYTFDNRCTDCKYSNGGKCIHPHAMYCQHCSLWAPKEYIEREALIAEYDRVHVGPAGGARKLMVEAPIADVAPRAEVAREIFEEIEDVINGIGYFDELDLKVLKNKYAGGQK